VPSKTFSITGPDHPRLDKFLIIEPLLPRLDEFVAAVVQGQVSGEALAFQRLMMHADEHATAGGIVLDLIEENGRVGLIARVQLGDGAHLQIPIDAWNAPQLAEFLDFRDPFA
jgi:hypothetical protein